MIMQRWQQQQQQGEQQEEEINLHDLNVLEEQSRVTSSSSLGGSGSDWLFQTGSHFLHRNARQQQQQQQQQQQLKAVSSLEDEKLHREATSSLQAAHGNNFMQSERGRGGRRQSLESSFLPRLRSEGLTSLSSSPVLLQKQKLAIGSNKNHLHHQPPPPRSRRRSSLFSDLQNEKAEPIIPLTTLKKASSASFALDHNRNSSNNISTSNSQGLDDMSTVNSTKSNNSNSTSTSTIIRDIFKKRRGSMALPLSSSSSTFSFSSSSFSSPEEDQKLGNDLYNLGTYHAQNHNWEHAIRAYNRALKRQRRVFGADHLQVAKTLNAVGVALTNIHEYYAAMTALQEALYIRQEQLGDGHSEVAETTSNLWKVLHRVKNNNNHNNKNDNHHHDNDDNDDNATDQQQQQQQQPSQQGEDLSPSTPPPPQQQQQQQDEGPPLSSSPSSPQQLMND